MRTLYLARHGAAAGDLTTAGRQQAALLGARLAVVPLTVVHHSPVPRAVQTAELVALELGGVPSRPSELLADYPPYLPAEAELPPSYAPHAVRHLEDYPAERRAAGPALGARALAEFATPTDADRHELIITHNQIVSWFVRAALDAPAWRWLGLNAANAGLTVIQYQSDRPPSLVMVNDLAHLPPELRWTGFPDERRVTC